VVFQLSDLSNSIFASLGVANLQDPLGLGASVHGRECIVLIDGMGQEAIEKYSGDFPVFNEFSRSEPMASHFPTTTATNLSSLGTGTLPGVHGMLGYTVRVPRSGDPGRLLNSLKWDDRVDPLMWQRQETNFQKAAASGVHVSHVAARRYEGSGFTQAALRGATYLGANQLSEIIESAAASLKLSPAFTYVYLNNLDHAGHEAGVGSGKWLSALSTVSDLLLGLIARVPTGTRIWLTADHGMINVGESVILGQDNNLLENVTLIGGEPRARHIYLRSGSETESVEKWREFFGSRAEIFSKKAMIESGLLGEFVSADSEDRLGDLIAVPNAELILIDPARIPQESSMVGHHGGLTTTELSIPLFTKVVD
jgi:hypothetical protein